MSALKRMPLLEVLIHTHTHTEREREREREVERERERERAANGSVLRKGRDIKAEVVLPVICLQLARHDVDIRCRY